MKLRVRVPGSCGELVQGMLQEDHFLVTCPIDRYAEASIEPARQFAADLPEKALRALELTLSRMGVRERRFRLMLRSQLPQGKGMASSSADIAAVCQAAAMFHGCPLSAADIGALAVAIEPTDAVFFPGVTLFDHVRGRIVESLGDPPPLEIAVFDAGGAVDTVSFNQRTDLQRMNRNKRPQVETALQLVRRGIAAGDAALLAQGATVSAQANQPILCKDELDAVWQIGRAAGALGINVAHSGTVMGLLFAAGSLPQEFAATVEKKCAARHLDTVRLIAGGLWIQEGDCDNWRKYI